MMLSSTSNARLIKSGSGLPASSAPRSSPLPSVRNFSARTMGPTLTAVAPFGDSSTPVSVSSSVFGASTRPRLEGPAHACHLLQLQVAGGGGRFVVADVIQVAVAE